MKINIGFSKNSDDVVKNTELSKKANSKGKEVKESSKAKVVNENNKANEVKAQYSPSDTIMPKKGRNAYIFFTKDFYSNPSNIIPGVTLAENCKKINE